MATWGSQVVNDVSGRWIQLGYDLNNSGAGFDTTSVNFELVVYLRTNYSISDSSNSFTISGDWSRSGAITVNTPSGGTTLELYRATINRGLPSWGSTASVSFSATISGLYNYGNAASVSGSSSVTRPTPSAPSAPGISVNTLGNGYVDFSFSAPSYGGDGGVSYYQYSSDNSSWTNYPSNPFRIYGTNGTTVYGYVRAVNAYGQAGPSAGASGVPRTVPSAPTSFAGDNSTFGQISLSWAAPTSNGGESVDGYVLRNGSTILQNSTATSYVHTGLSPYTDYSYTVTARNDAGEGAAASLTIKTMGGIGKVWNGTSYVTVLPKVWNGTTWADAQARMWTGTEWKHGI